MKTAILFIDISLTSLNCLAQKDTSRTINAKNAVFVELIGSGIFYSLNYERAFRRKLTLRVGAAYTGREGWFSEIWTIPISAAYLITTDHDSHIELGAANTFMLENGKVRLFPGPVIGFREQDLIKGGAFGRITFTPLFFMEEKLKLFPLLGLSFGASF